MYKDNLLQLRQQSWFKDFTREVLENNCPKIPEYSPRQQSQNWEYGSGLRHGYLLALNDLGIKID